jgi:hypothetical protein
MPSDQDSTPIPLQVLASLRTLAGEDFKVMGALCYWTHNKQTPQVTLEQIHTSTGIPYQQLKPVLYRLKQRAWIFEHGASYQLAFQHSQPSVTIAQADSVVKYDPALGIRPPRPKVHLLYPEGPWLTENGLLNEDFVRDRAQVWRTGNHAQTKAFAAMAIEDVMGAVCKHYAKPENHANLEIDWQSYWLKNQRYLNNIQQRLHAGTTIDEAEQATVLKKLPSVMQQIELVYESVLPVAELHASAPPMLSEPSQSESQAVDEAIPQKPEEIRARLRGIVAEKTMPSERLTHDRLGSVEKLRLWLSDPILRPEAERLARAQGYELGYNQEGIAVDIVG